MELVGGVRVVGFMFFLLFVYETFASLQDYWLSYWSSNFSAEFQYLLTFIVLAGMKTGVMIIRCAMFSIRGLIASTSLHTTMLQSGTFAHKNVVSFADYFQSSTFLCANASPYICFVMGSPVSFFDTTPIGRILNRFSHDINELDDPLPIYLEDFCSSFVSLMVCCITIAIGTPLFLLFVVPVGKFFIVRSIIS